MNEDTRMLLRFICDGDLRRSQAQAQIILKHITTKKDEDFAKQQLSKLENAKTRFIQLPANLENLLVAEDSSFFPESRFLVRKKEQDIVDQILRIRMAAQKLKEMSLSYTPTLMLYGASGTGKTMLAKYIAYKAGIPYLYVRFSGLVGQYLGSTQNNIARVFDYARREPCVLCFDEIDSVGMARGQKNDIGEMNRIVITLMQEMDRVTNDMIVIGTTNRFDRLDPAMLRRFTVVQEIFPFTEEETCDLVQLFYKSIDEEISSDEAMKWLTTYCSENPGMSFYPYQVIKTLKQQLVDRIANETQR